MNGTPSRRALLRAFAASAMLPALVQSGAAVARDTSLSIRPPSRPMIFRRRLKRELAAGYSIVAERSFAVRFLPLVDGYRIDGEQRSSEIEVPPNLEAIARLERQRREEGMFPLVLDETGLIRASASAVPAEGLDQAVKIALDEVAARLTDKAEIIEARTFLLGLQQAAGRISSTMPVDLFTPPQVARRASREVDLPGGMSGRVSTQFGGSISPRTGLLEDAERIILTETDGTRRRTVESWSLHPPI